MSPHENISNLTDQATEQFWADFIRASLQNESRWIQVTFLVVMSLIIIFGLLGNLLTCVVIYYDRTMHTATNYYLFNLAVSDFFVTFAIFFELHEQISESYNFGQLFCKIHFALVLMLWNNSILTMTALAIERYIAIWYPLALKSTPVWKRVLKIIILIWVLAIVESLPDAWTVELIKTKQAALCFTIPSALARVVNSIQAICSFVAPLVIMTFVYGMIAFKVTSMNRRTNMAETVFNHRDNSGRVNKLVGLTLSFVVCWLPFFALRMVFIFYSDSQILVFAIEPEWWGICYKIVVFNSWFGVVLNPVLFSLMSTKFRKALKELWSKKFKRKRLRKYELTENNIYI